METKKIVIVGTAYPYRGGIANFNERVATEFESKGHNVEIYTFTLQYPSFLFPGKTQYSTEKSDNKLNIKRKVNSINPFNWIRVGLELKKMKPDIIVFRHWTPFMAPCLGTISRIAKKNKHSEIKLIVDNVFPHEKLPFQKMLAKYIIKSADSVVVMSKKVLSDLKQVAPKVNGSFLYHPLYDNYGKAIDKQEAIRQLNIDANYKYLLFFGFIREYKGLDILLKSLAIDKIKNSDIKLIVAGEFYDDEAKYQKIISDYNIADKLVMFSTYISNSQIPVIFSACDLVVQPYKSATQSGVAQLAYFYEKPMVITNVGGLHEIVPDNKVGYVVNPDPQEISDAIFKFFDEQKAAEFTENIKVEKQRFSWSTFVDGLLAVGS